MQGNYSLTASFIICGFVYFIAFTVAYAFIFFYTGSLSPLWLALIADVIATLVVYSFSLLFKNSSLYDPYWSVVPPFIAAYWVATGRSGEGPVLAMAAIVLWAIRLTYNWARGWQGLVHEDWRYIMLRNKNPKLYWLTNFGGIHMFPTLMVFAGMLPVYYTTRGGHYVMCEGNTYNVLALIGFAVCIAATIIELVADGQMRRFKKRAQPGHFIDEGIWRYSRHPNYFGEILFWFGLWVIQLSGDTANWWTSIGWLAMLGMFLFASIPMMEEKNLKSKPGYATYVKQVSALIPWFRKSA